VIFGCGWILVKQAKADVMEQSELGDTEMSFILVRLQNMTMTT